MLKLKDKNKKLITGLTNYKDLCIESTLTTGDKKLSFSLHKKDKFYGFIEEECYIETKTQEFVIKARDVGVDYTRFDCVLNLEGLEANIFDRFESKEQTITYALNLAIVNTGWTVKPNTLKKKRTVRCSNKNALEIVQVIKKTYRVDIVFNTLKRQIEVCEHLGEDRGAYFIDSLNLTALQVQSDSYKFATRIIAEGKDGLSFADINGGKNYVENYKYSNKIKTIYWKDERYTVKESLLEDAKAKLREISKPFTSYNASILNLAELNPKYKNILDYRLGDTITLLSKSNKVKDKQRIVKVIEYPLDHSRDTVELANAVLKFEDIQQENQETTDTVNNITTDNGTVDGSTIDSITTKQIEDFKANVLEVANLKSVNANIDNLHANKADIQDLHAVTAKIGTLETTKANITQLNATNAEISKLNAIKADITDLNAAVGKINVLETKAASIDNLISDKADIKDLNALNANISKALIKKATIAELEAMEAKTNKLIANKADISDLNATNANINSLKTYTADIKTLLNGNLSSENIQTGGITSDKLVIANGFIKDAMIDSINVNKLNAGTLATDKFNIRSRDGNLIIKDNTIQIKDSSNVRVQIGKDASGDYSLYVWDKLGNLMFNALGITKNAIKDKIIRNDMVTDDAAIEGKKLNIESVIREVNNSKSNLKASKIDIDTKGQTLDIAFSNLVTESGKNKEELVSLITKLNVQQGQINASIENSKILEDKQKNLEDNYNRTIVTVDSLKNTVGQQKTLIDSASGKITSVEVKANTLEKNLSGLTQTVTDTKKVIENNKTSLESKNAELKANIDKVSSSLSSVSNTVDKNNKALVSKSNKLEQNLSGLTQTVANNKTAIDGKIKSVENVTHELKAGLGGLTSKLDTLKSTTDGINKTVINQGSAINQLKDSIKLKIDSSTFNKSTETINNSIKKAKEDAVNTANSNTTNAINGIKIGIENLIDNGDLSFDMYKFQYADGVVNYDGEKCLYQTVNTNNESFIATSKYDFSNLAGKKITISFFGAKTNNVSSVECFVLITKKGSNKDWDYCPNRRFNLTEKLQCFEWTLELPVDSEKCYIRFDNNGSTDGANATLYITKIKVVEGTIKSAWSPSANDLKKYSDDVAKAKSDLAKTEAIANADGKITAEEQKRIVEAKKNLDIAIAKSEKAKADAINTASADATNKANNALNNAKAYTNAEITTVNTHLSKNTSEINILKEKIESKVSKNDIDKSITNIQIGGKNLLPFTKDFKSRWNLNCGGLTDGLDGCKAIINKRIEVPSPEYRQQVVVTNINGLSKGDMVTISGYYYIDSSINLPNDGGNEISVRVYYNGKNNFYDILNTKFNSSTKGKWIYFNTTSLLRKDVEISKVDLLFSLSKMGFIKLTKVKLEKGNKPTDWSPAPEDTDKLIIDNIKTVTDKISTVESKITQENNSIKASVQDLNSTTQTITTNVSNINRDLTSKINSNLDVAKKYAEDVAIAKANLAKAEAIANADGKITAEERKRIQQAEANLNTAIARADKAKQDAINTASTDATNKANNALNSAKAFVNAEITTVNNKVHNVESNLNILKDQIKSKVSQSNIDKSISNITIGVRNLALGTSLNYSNPYSGFDGGINKCPSVAKVITDGLKIGDIVTVRLLYKYGNIVKASGKTNSAWLQGAGDVTGWGSGAFSSNGVSLNNFSGNGIYEFLYSFTVTKEHIKNNYWDVNLRHDYILSGSVCWKMFKVEKGNKATDWTPAPEDTNSLIVDSIKVVNSKISDVSSSVTQLRDSVTTQINSINSKTHSIETNLGGKASKQEVTEVNNRVATIKASLDSITQRVSSTESKTKTLESNINGKASKQEVNNVSSKVVSLVANLNGITNRVSSAESKINSVDGKVKNATTKQEFTEFKQNTDKFIWDIQKNGSFIKGNTVTVDRNKLRCQFEDGTYAEMGRNGFEWYNANTGHSYHALSYVTSFDIPVGNPGRAYIKLPAEFTKRKSSLRWTVALRGYYYSTTGNFFPCHVHCTGSRDYVENGQVVCEVQGYCKIQNANNSNDIQHRPLTAMLIAVA